MKITKKLIQDLVDSEYALQEYTEDQPVRPVAKPPVSKGELEALESYLRGSNLAIPPSYRDFLSIANGIAGFKSNFSLVSAQEITIPPHRSLVRRYAKLSKFMFGRGNSLEFVAFDPDKATGGEMEVVSVSDDGNESRYPDFAQYLHARLGQLQKALKLEEADRKGLKD
jgi:hypothetical protein